MLGQTTKKEQRNARNYCHVSLTNAAAVAAICAKPGSEISAAVCIAAIKLKGKKMTDFQIPLKLYRIGEVVRYTPFTRQTIHNYTTMGLIQEIDWTEGGHRLYDESVFERLKTIQELRKTNSLVQIRKILSATDPDTDGTQRKAV